MNYEVGDDIKEKYVDGFWLETLLCDNVKADKSAATMMRHHNLCRRVKYVNV